MNSPKPNTFDPANARELCAASAAAYNTAFTLGRSAEAKLEQRSIDCEITDTHVLIRQRGHDVTLAFRGTADLRNWLTDLDCEFVPFGNCRVHRGFFEAMNAVEPDLSAALGEAQGARIWLTGHSLGGALAMLWALWAVRNGYEIAGVYTFGQPRVGDAAFRQLYDARLKPWTWRSIHAADIVPRVPWLLGHYRHAGHEVFYPSPVASLPILDRPCWTRLLAEAAGLARELCRGQVALLADHHVNNYVALFPESCDAACAVHS